MHGLVPAGTSWNFMELYVWVHSLFRVCLNGVATLWHLQSWSKSCMVWSSCYWILCVSAYYSHSPLHLQSILKTSWIKLVSSQWARYKPLVGLYLAMEEEHNPVCLSLVCYKLISHRNKCREIYNRSPSKAPTYVLKAARSRGSNCLCKQFQQVQWHYVSMVLLPLMANTKKICHLGHTGFFNCTVAGKK